MMRKEILHKVKEDFHSKFMACGQFIDWNIKGFTEELADAYIVQELLLEESVDGYINRQAHYYEAWNVSAGECIKGKGDECHDIFSIGYPYDYANALGQSIGHTGRVVFIPKIFWIEKDKALYETIDKWEQRTVKEANGLKSAYFSEELKAKFQKTTSYWREPFVHEWKFDEPEEIYKTVLEYFKMNFHPGKEIERRNFAIDLDDFFPEGVYPDIKYRIRKDWECQ